jgi:6-phosphofructokinase 2
MIVTLTFSPSIDKSFSVPQLVPDKKLKTSVPHLDPGGGGINVARAIHILGGSATAVFPSGGYTGKHFNQLLKNEGVPYVIIESVNETRENIVVVDESKNLQYRFGMPGTELKEREWQKCLEVIEEMDSIEFLVASGSLPPGVPEDIFARLALISKKKNAKYIVDTSGLPLKLAIEAGLYLVKPNLGELSAFAGLDYLSNEQARNIASEIVESGKSTAVVVSMGAAGAMLVTREGVEIFQSPHVERKSTVGAGDSMVAGIVYSLAQKKSPSEAVRYGVACGTAATMNEGTELCRKRDVEYLYSKVILNTSTPLSTSND